jgi:hypothetical protein
VLSASVILMAARGVVTPEIRTGDEGFYGTSALNMCRAFEFWVRPSATPGDNSFWKQGGPDIGHPPLYPAVLALVACPTSGDATAMPIVSLAAFLCSIYFFYRTVTLWDRDAALLGVVLFSVSPSILYEFRLMEAEPVVVAFGMMGLYGIARGATETRRHLCLLGGAALGLAFITKLWLVAPFVLAAFALGGAIILGRDGRRWGAEVMWWSALGFVGTTPLHLAFVALTAPADLGIWVRDVYLSVLTSSGIGSTKLSGASAPPNWTHPFWYYPVILYRAHFFLMPLILAGVLSGIRRRRPFHPVAVAVMVAGCIALLPLSVPAVKESLYMLPVLPFLYGLSGMSVAGAGRADREGEAPVPRWAPTAVAVITSVLVVGVGLAFAVQGGRGKVSGWYAIAHTLGMSVSGWVAMLVLRGNMRRAILAIGVAAGVGTAVAAVYEVTAAGPSYRRMAEVIRPYVERLPPDRIAFIAPNYKVPQFYLFRAGRYWSSFHVRTNPEKLLPTIVSGEICAFILGPDERESQDLAEIRKWLHTHGMDLSGQLTQREEGFSVYVHRACAT